MSSFAPSFALSETTWLVYGGRLAIDVPKLSNQFEAHRLGVFLWEPIFSHFDCLKSGLVSNLCTVYHIFRISARLVHN